MTDAAAMSRDVERAAARSTVYGVLSLGLCPPETPGVERLQEATTRQALLDAVAALEADYAVLRGARDMRHAATARDDAIALTLRAARLAGFLPVAGTTALRDAHDILFGHTARGRVCPYEAEYGHDEAIFQHAQTLADLGGFYAAFGLELDAARRDRVDHASCELEFMEFLCRKEAFAAVAGDEETVAVTQQAERRFLADHLGKFARAFGLSLAENDSGLHGALGDLLFDFVTLECRSARVAPGPAVVRLRSTQEPEVPMQCGSTCDPTSCRPSGTPA